jgi:hypothetical protein
MKAVLNVEHVKMSVKKELLTGYILVEDSGLVLGTDRGAIYYFCFLSKDRSRCQRREDYETLGR